MKQKTQKKKKKVLVLVVAYNAEGTIMKLLDRIPDAAWEKVDEVLIADDASRDKTAELVRAYQKEHRLKKLKVVRHEQNKGYGGNQKWGYHYAMQDDFDIVVMIHGDVQYPPEYIPTLLQPLEEERADFVFGSRMAGHPLRGGMPLYKFFGNIFLTTVENLVLGTRLSEFHSGFRAYRVAALRELPLHLNSDEFHFDSEIIFQLVAAGKKIDEIVIPTFYGDEKSNVKVIPYGLNILKELTKHVLHRWKLRREAKYDVAAFEKYREMRKRK